MKPKIRNLNEKKHYKTEKIESDDSFTFLESSTGNIYACNYTVERKENVYYIHRQIKLSEFRHYSPEETITIKGIVHVYRVATCTTFLDAINVVQGYWDMTKTIMLNSNDEGQPKVGLL